MFQSRLLSLGLSEVDLMCSVLYIPTAKTINMAPRLLQPLRPLIHPSISSIQTAAIHKMIAVIRDLNKEEQGS